MLTSKTIGPKAPPRFNTCAAQNTFVRRWIALTDVFYYLCPRGVAGDRTTGEEHVEARAKRAHHRRSQCAGGRVWPRLLPSDQDQDPRVLLHPHRCNPTGVNGDVGKALVVQLTWGTDMSKRDILTIRINSNVPLEAKFIKRMWWFEMPTHFSRPGATVRFEMCRLLSNCVEEKCTHESSTSRDFAKRV